MVPARETVFLSAVAAGLILFFSTVEYTRLQWVTGIRYLVSAIPFLFVLVAAVLIRLPKPVAVLLGLMSIGEAWAMSMARRVGDPSDRVIDSILSVARDGVQLPWLTTLGNMGTRYMTLLGLQDLSAVPILVAGAVVICGLWWIPLGRDSARRPGAPVFSSPGTMTSLPRART
jgi:hypothetical protein